MFCLFTASPMFAQGAKPRKHAMPMPGMQMGHENHTPVSDLRVELMKVWNAADSNHLTALFGESAVIILPSGDLVTGRQSIREFFQHQMSKHLSIALNSVGFESSPDLEVDFGIFTSSKEMGRNPSASTDRDPPHSFVEGKYMMVVKRTGSEWKIQEIMLASSGKAFSE